MHAFVDVECIVQSAGGNNLFLQAGWRNERNERNDLSADALVAPAFYTDVRTWNFLFARRRISFRDRLSSERFEEPRFL